MKRIIIPLLIAAFLWFFMFSPWTSGIFNFWTAMSFSAIVLMNMAFALRPQWWIEDVKFDWKNIAGGVGLAVVLWGVFWLGDKASAWLFDFARPQVELIYGMKTGENPWLLSILLLILIGPAEEIFWRGYVQNALSKRWSPNVGFIVATLVYALVHIWSFNFMLVMAAAIEFIEAVFCIYMLFNPLARHTIRLNRAFARGMRVQVPDEVLEEMAAYRNETADEEDNEEVKS